MLRRLVPATAAAGAALSMLSACGGGTPNPTAVPPSASSTAQAAAAGTQLQTAAAPVLKALGKFRVTERTAGPSPSAASLQQDAAPAIAALQTFQSQLGSITFPPDMAPQVNQLVAADSSLVNALQTITPTSITGGGAVNEGMIRFTEQVDGLLTALGAPV